MSLVEGDRIWLRHEEFFFITADHNQDGGQSERQQMKIAINKINKLMIRNLALQSSSGA